MPKKYLYNKKAKKVAYCHEKMQKNKIMFRNI